MRASGRPLLGVDINPYEIRVVEMRGTAANPQIVRAAAAPTPRGAVEGDRVVFPDAVADTLRGLIGRMGTSTRSAVIGIGAQSVITRILDIPRVPESEARMVIEGELAHYQILREGTGAFDFLQLHDADRMADSSPQALMMAAEERVVATYTDIADRAGLHLVALEPLLLGMYRAAWPRIQAQPSAICVLVGYGRTEIAIVDHGQIRLYRRVDFGSDDLVAGRRPTRGPGGLGGHSSERVLLGDDAPEPEVLREPTPGEIVQSAATSLATELQRSLDYYRREYPQATTVSRTILATHDPQAEPLAEWLSQALRIDVEAAEPPISIDVGRAIASQLEAPHGLRFLAAAGLAMHELPGLADSVPRFNLALRDRVDPEVAQARRSLTMVLASSVALAMIGLVVVLTLARNASQLEHNVEFRKSQLGARRMENESRIQMLRAQRDQVRILKAQGFPFPRIMDAIAVAVDPEAGLRNVGLSNAGALALEGEASNERAIIRTLEGLKRCPYFFNTSLDSFEWVSDNQSRLLRFNISSQLAGTQTASAATATQ